MKAEAIPGETRQIDIVVLAFNHEPYVEQALDSVFDQSYKNFRLTVIDDGSADSTQGVIQNYLDRTGRTAEYIRHERNMGVCSSLNEALRMTKADYVVFMAADDWMNPQRVEKQLRVLEAVGPTYGLVHSNMTIVDGTGARSLGTFMDNRVVLQGDVFIDLLSEGSIGAPSVMLRRAAFDVVGYYDESLPAEDYDMWLRIARRFKFAYIPEQLVNYRVLGTSLSRTLDSNRMWQAKLVTLRKHIGVSDEADEIIIPRIDSYARKLYLNGKCARESSRDFWLVARRRPNARTFRYLAASSAGLPGPWIPRAASIARRCLRLGAIRGKAAGRETSRE